MRPSPFRHTLAVLRTTIGLTQKEMATLAECSTATIQAIELGKLKLSERLAGLISVRTGVSMKWLLDNNTAEPPKAPDGMPYTKEFFQEARALDTDKTPPVYKQLQPILSYDASIQRLAILLLKAAKDQKSQLCAYKISTALDDLERAFGVQEPDKDFFNKFYNKEREQEEGQGFSPGNAPFVALVAALRALDPEYDGWRSITRQISFFLSEGGEIMPMPPGHKPNPHEFPSTTTLHFPKESATPSPSPRKKATALPKPTK